MHRIFTSDKIQALTGEGEEWLISKEGEVRAKFYDGRLIRAYGNNGNDETTVKCA